MTLTLVFGAAVAGSGQDLDSLISPGPLSRFHSELVGLRNCTSCHAPGKGVSDDKCLACHEDLNVRLQGNRGFHKDKKEECTSCHNEHQGETFELVAWDKASFDHGETGYDLVGLHRNVEECASCHRPENAPARVHAASFFVNDTRCVACHTDVHHGSLGEDCTSCHSVEVKFTDVVIQHDRTAFPLVGAHRSVACEKCHRDGQWKGLRFGKCTDCHSDPHRPSLGPDCRSCHNERSWTKATFDHSAARFPLLGKHADVECNQCHREDVAGGEGVTRNFRGLAFEECRDCHVQDPHFGQFEGDCASCHTVSGFQETTFSHAQSLYPLTGKHASVACEKCHAVERESLFPMGRATAVRYKPLATLCDSCHVDVHIGQFEDKSCESCHVTEGFTGTHLQFVHNRDSRFVLRESHAQALCQRCHRAETGAFPAGTGEATRYRPLSDLCIACHDNVHDESWWRGEVAKVTECDQCHTERTFHLDRFDHGRTSFRIDGAHQGIACDGCHDFAVSAGARYLLFQGGSGARDCGDCHRSPHLKGMERCLECHTTSTWRVGA